jgi:uncharacterized protein with HEPN domain
VLRAIEVIGEAANKVSEDIRLVNADIPWMAIVGMRNRLIHAYFDVDTDMVWETVQVEIPDLLTKLTGLLAQSGR